MHLGFLLKMRRKTMKHTSQTYLHRLFPHYLYLMIHDRKERVT